MRPNAHSLVIDKKFREPRLYIWPQVRLVDTSMPKYAAGLIPHLQEHSCRKDRTANGTSASVFRSVNGR